jgi:hypothetical protein
MINIASASSSWTQTTDEDFDEGYHFNTTIIGEGEKSDVILDIAQTPHWTKKSPSGKPSGRSYHSMASLYGTDKVLLFGGSVSNKAVNDTWVYDLSANSWTEKKPKKSPYPRGGPSIAAIYNTDKVLLFGGVNQTALNETWIYDLSNNAWVIKYPSISPPPRYSHRMAPINGTDKVMLFGGYPGGTYSYPYNDTWIYDLSENNWTNKTSVKKPHARYAHAIAYIDGTDKIVLFGGRYRNWSYDIHFNDTWIYDYSENNWTQKYPVESPIGNNNHLMVTIYGTDNVVYYAGINGIYLIDICIYDYSENNWTIHTPMYFPRTGSTLGFASVDRTDKAIFFGAWSGSSRDETWIYDNSIKSMKGFYLSPEFYTYTNPNYKTIKWNDFTPPGTSISLQFRTAPFRNWLHTRNFVGPDGTTSSYYTNSPASIRDGHNADDWMQFRVYFSTNNLPNVPYISDITIIFNWIPEEPELLKPVNNTWVKKNRPLFTWNFSDPDSNTQGGFQWQADDDINFTSIDFDSDEVNSNSTTYSPIHPISDGVWYWRVRTKDSHGDWSDFSDGNVIRIDSTIEKPNNLMVEPDGWTAFNPFKFQWENPVDLTGIEGVYYKLDTPPISNVDGIFISKKEINSIKGVYVKGDGEHIIYIWLKDKLGNVNYNKYGSVKFYLDSTPPPPPNNIIIDPNDWTNEDSFAISWENPDDLSGIGGVYYKLNYAPTSHNDGTYLSGNEIDFINNISVKENGENTIFIWLHDNVGNVDYENYNTALLYFDDVPPQKPNDVINTQDFWSSKNSFSINWTNSSDISGIKKGAYYYINNKPPSSQLDGTWISNKPFIISNAREGISYIYIWLEDNVGNKNYLNNDYATIKLDTTPPTISHTPVNSGTVSKEIIISVEISDELSGINEVLLYYKKSVDKEYTMLNMEEENHNYSAKIPADIITTNGVEYYIQASDKSTPSNVIYYGIDEITTIKPINTTDISIKIYPLLKIVDKDPIGENVQVESTINITFNKNMNKEVTKNAFSIDPSIHGEFRIFGKKLIFTPDASLAYNTTYTVTISKLAKDIEGNYLLDDFKWTFTTIKKEDNDHLNTKKEPGEKEDTNFIWIILGIIIIIFVILILIFLISVKRKKKEKTKLETTSKVAQEKPLQPQPQLSQPQQVLQQQPPQVQTKQQLKVQPTPQIEKPQQNLCISCGLTLTFYSQNNRYYCHHCQKYE